MLKGRATFEGPRQAGWKGQKELYEIQQGQMPSPTPGVKLDLGTIQAKEQLGRKELYGPGGRQTACKSGVCLGSGGGS